MAFVVVVLIANLVVHGGGNGAGVVLGLVMAVTALRLQTYFVKRDLCDWRDMSAMGRWGTAVAAAVVPLAAGFVAPIVVIVALVVWVRSGFPVGGVSLPSAKTADAGSGFGSWWGGDRVVTDAAGQPAWVGDEQVTSGADGRPAWVGDREVIYGVGGRMAWVGDDQVTHGSDGTTPTWVGDQKID